jgi:hypothetical protein
MITQTSCQDLMTDPFVTKVPPQAPHIGIRKTSFQARFRFNFSAYLHLPAQPPDCEPDKHESRRA